MNATVEQTDWPAEYPGAPPGNGGPVSRLTEIRDRHVGRHGSCQAHHHGMAGAAMSTTAKVRRTLIPFVAGLALINATGVFAQLVSAHIGDRGAAASHLEAQTAGLEAKIDIQAHKIADLDRRLGQIDSTVEETGKRGRTNAAISVMEGQNRPRAALVDERNREAGNLAAVKAERASVAAQGKRIETEAHPSAMSPSSSGSTPTARRRSGG
jgi:hypothetical protein